jgi:O-succinylbenzoic acid--CoA ligase
MTRLVPDWLGVWAGAAPDRLALVAASGTWSMRELDHAAVPLAADLARQDVGEGTLVASLLSDDAPAVTLMHATRRLGAVLVPLNRRAADAELEAHLRDAGARVLAHDADHAVRAATLASESGAMAFVVELAQVLWAPAADALRDDVDLDAPAAIVFTSGTTDRPRGVTLSHGNLAASADAWAAVLDPRPTDRWLCCLPLFHVAGLAIVTRASRWGVPVEVMAAFRPGKVAERMLAGISHVSLVPAQLGPVLDVLVDAGPVPASLRAVLLGGGPIPEPLLQRARTMGLPVLTTYGMTETASGVAVGGADPETLADPTALRALPGVGLRIADADDQGMGRIEVSGPTVAAALAGRDGWLRTGDVGTLDDRGLLRIIDRRDDLIVSGGENVSPAEVEAVLRTHPDVRDVAVVGRPDPTWGSVPVAEVVLSDGSTASDTSLERHCRQRLAGYKVPVRFHRLSALPRNAAGKVERRELRRTLSDPDRAADR